MKPLAERCPGVQLLALALAVVLAACGLFANPRGQQASGDGRAYPHDVHLEEGFACVDCHRTAVTDARAGMPASSACEVCHEGFLDEPGEHPEVAAFFPGGQPSWHGFSRLGGDLRFSHREHAEAKVACRACHGDMATSRSVTPAIRLDKDDCQGCHDERAVTSACESCHETIRSDVAPASHGPSWAYLHGDVSRDANRSDSVHRCSQCHTRSSCDGCHARVPPRRHTALWRRRTHGIAAGFDRDRCTTCHRSDSCVVCHETTRPMSHTAGWGVGPAYLHCTQGCHTVASAAGCATCHRSLQGHADAAPLSGNQIPPHPMPPTTSRCTLCHEQL